MKKPQALWWYDQYLAYDSMWYDRGTICVSCTMIIFEQNLQWKYSISVKMLLVRGNINIYIVIIPRSDFSLVSASDNNT